MRRSAAKAEENPKTTWIVLGVATVAAGAAAAFWWHRSQAASTGTDTGSTNGKILNYVGAPGYVWPHKDRFPNQVAFGLLLQQLGYDPGDLASPTFTITSAKAMNAVAGFQRDYNIVRQNKLHWDFIEQGTQSTGSIDGLLGPKTIEALRNAEAWQQAGNLTWADLVDLTQAETS